MASVYMRVTYEDGQSTVVRVGPKTQIAFERHFDVAMFKYERRLEHMYWMCWHALSQTGTEGRGFDDWLTDVDDVTYQIDTPDNPVGDEAVNPEPDPSQKAQPAETSSS
jgi:hypothetical protein